MFTSQIKYGLVGAFIGMVIGLAAGAGLINYSTTKGQRGTATDVVIIAVAGIGSIIGIRIGSGLGADVYKEEQLGLNNLNEGMFKSGRYWAAMTSWREPGTDREVKLITGKDSSGTLVSTINLKTIIRHPTTSGSQVNVTKHHNHAKGQVFRTIKDNYRSGKTVEQIFGEL